MNGKSHKKAPSLIEKTMKLGALTLMYCYPVLNY